MGAKAIFFIIAVMAFCMGAFIYFYPRKVLQIQKKFYAMINWNIEPISEQKEIRNTKAMGLFLIFFVILSCFWI